MSIVIVIDFYPEAPSTPDFRNHGDDDNNDDDEFSFLESAF